MSIRQTARLTITRLGLLGLGCALFGPPTPGRGQAGACPWWPAPQPSPADPTGPWTPPLPDLPILPTPTVPPGITGAPPALLTGNPSPAPTPGAGPLRGPLQLSNKSEGGWGSLTSTVTVQDGRTPAWEEPQWKRAWQTQEAWQVTVAGPVYVFGQLGGNSDEAAGQNMKVNGRTGLACKVPIGPAELTLRGGPGVSYTDPLHPLLTREQTDCLLEVQARCPLLCGVGLEYQGTAYPALGPQQQDQIKQDVRLAIPVGAAGKVQVGARHQWLNTTEPRPLLDTLQLYLGLELKR